MSRSIILFVIIGVSVLLIAGCASIIKGTSQDISIQSEPSDATVVVKTIGGVEVFNGKTPASAHLSKKKEYLVTVNLQGYKEATVSINQSFEGWFIGNLLCGGVIGMIIDAVDGAMYKLEPEQIKVAMVTASLENGGTKLYAVFFALDDEGQLRSMSVPMIAQ